MKKQKKTWNVPLLSEFGNVAVLTTVKNTWSPGDGETYQAERNGPCVPIGNSSCGC